jgi:hypothetical protein
MRTHSKLAMALVAVVALIVPATAQAETGCLDAEGNLVLTEQQSWIHDTGGIKGGNLAPLGATDFPSWDDTEPTSSVTEGAGGGYLASSAGLTAAGELGAPTDPWDEQYTATLKGAFDGCLDTMAVTLHMFAQLDPALLNFHMMAARLYDGDTLVVDSEPAEVSTELNPNGSGDITYVVRFAFRNLVNELEAAGIDPGGAHELTLQLQPVFSDVGHVVYLWDTTEVPSGIHFNAPNIKPFTALN